MNRFTIGTEVKVCRKGMPWNNKIGVVIDRLINEQSEYAEYVVKFDEINSHRYLEEDLKIYSRKIDNFMNWLRNSK